MELTDLIKLAEAYGEDGRGWTDFTFANEVTQYVDSYGAGDVNAGLAALQGAHRRGEIRHLEARGWVRRWTTAPADYDTFHTTTIATEEQPWLGKYLRLVLIDPIHETYQCDRYGSGLHGSWAKNPREEHERFAAERAEADRRDAEAKERRAAGLKWLEGLSDAQLEDVVDDGEGLDGQGVEYRDARAEQRERRDEAKKIADAELLARLRALVPDGCAIVDDGRARNKIGDSRPSRVFYDVRVKDYGLGPEKCVVSGMSDGRYCTEIGKLGQIVELISSGHRRVVRPEDLGQLPPRPVLNRFGHAKLAEIRKFEVEGREVWVRRESWTYEIVVLDAAGHLVRKRSVIEAAEMMYASAAHA
jgi:hypothetical protein